MFSVGGSEGGLIIEVVSLLYGGVCNDQKALACRAVISLDTRLF